MSTKACEHRRRRHIDGDNRSSEVCSCKRSMLSTQRLNRRQSRCFLPHLQHVSNIIIQLHGKNSVNLEASLSASGEDRQPPGDARLCAFEGGRLSQPNGAWCTTMRILSCRGCQSCSRWWHLRLRTHAKFKKLQCRLRLNVSCWARCQPSLVDLCPLSSLAVPMPELCHVQMRTGLW